MVAAGKGGTQNAVAVVMQRFVWVIFACLIGMIAASSLDTLAEQRGVGTVAAASLPKEAQQTIALIKRGGPYPFKRDGVVFGNFEKRLPIHARGYYHEFTVPTPGTQDRGARRIIFGKAGELFYTDDHYQTFRRVLE